MKDVKNTLLGKSQEESENLTEDLDTDKKKKKLDEMIEEFKKANPAKNPKRIYGGVY